MAALLVGAAGLVLYTILAAPQPPVPAAATSTPTATATARPDPVIAVVASECAAQTPRPGEATTPPLRCSGSARVLATEPIGPVHIWLVLENDEGKPFYACRQDMPATTTPGTVITWAFACDTDNKVPSGHRARFTDANGAELPSRDDRQR